MDRCARHGGLERRTAPRRDRRCPLTVQQTVTGTPDGDVSGTWSSTTAPSTCCRASTTRRRYVHPGRRHRPGDRHLSAERPGGLHAGKAAHRRPGGEVDRTSEGVRRPRRPLRRRPRLDLVQRASAVPELPEVRAHAERLEAESAGAVVDRFEPLSFTALKTAEPPIDDAVGRSIRSIRSRASARDRARSTRRPRARPPATFLRRAPHAGRPVHMGLERPCTARGGQARCPAGPSIAAHRVGYRASGRGVVRLRRPRTFGAACLARAGRRHRRCRTARPSASPPGR